MRRELARNNAEIYLPDVADTLKELAILDRNQNSAETSRNELKEALGIYKQFAAANPERFQSDIASVEHLLTDK